MSLLRELDQLADLIEKNIRSRDAFNMQPQTRRLATAPKRLQGPGMKRGELPAFDGKSAFDGALRFLDRHDQAWFDSWAGNYRQLLPKLTLFASDAFGVLFGLDGNGEVSIFWTDSGEVENLGVAEETFYRLIRDDPDGTINLAFYQEAVLKFGCLALDQDFAFKVEIALGGNIEIENLYICPTVTHLASLGKIARQIHSVALGTKMRPTDST